MHQLTIDIIQQRFW